MRIIGGSARGRAIHAPHGLDTRPTQDRVRESLFNILRPAVMGVRVLDGFAGSGALGLEALSLGAAYAVFVDHGREAQQVIRRNIDLLGFTDRATLLPVDFRKALSTLVARGEVFDLVFLDPPYDFPHTGDMAGALTTHRLLAPGARVIIEHRRKSPPACPAGMVQLDIRHYGDTSITFFAEEEKHDPLCLPRQF